MPGVVRLPDDSAERLLPPGPDREGRLDAAARTPTAIAEAAKKWLKDNAEKYRIERFVADKKDDK